jgi:hypothetical protein
MITWHEARCFNVMKVNTVNKWRYTFACGFLSLDFIIKYSWLGVSLIWWVNFLNMIFGSANQTKVVGLAEFSCAVLASS